MTGETLSEAMARLRADYERLYAEAGWVGRMMIRRNLLNLDQIQREIDARRDKTLEAFRKDAR